MVSSLIVLDFKKGESYPIQVIELLTNVSGVQGLLGVAYQMGKFIPNTAETTLLLKMLLVKGNWWVWSDS